MSCNNLPRSAFSTQDDKELSDSDSDTSSSVADSDNSIPLWEDQTEDIYLNINYVFGMDEESIMEQWKYPNFTLPAIFFFHFCTSS